MEIANENLRPLLGSPIFDIAAAAPAWVGHRAAHAVAEVSFEFVGLEQLP